MYTYIQLHYRVTLVVIFMRYFFPYSQLYSYTKIKSNILVDDCHTQELRGSSLNSSFRNDFSRLRHHTRFRPTISISTITTIRTVHNTTHLTRTVPRGNTNANIFE